VNSLELSFEDGMAEVNADIISRMPVATTSGTLVTTSGTLFTFKDAEVKMGSSITDAENSPTTYKLKSFRLTIENNAEPVYVVGNNDVDSIVVKNFKVSGEFALNFEDTTHRDIFRNLTKRAMVVTFTGNGIGGGMNEFIKIRIAKLRYEDYAPDLPIDDLATEGITFVGEYDSGESKTIDIVVRNRKSSY